MMFEITTFRECYQQALANLTEKWSDAARQGSIRARQAQAKYKTDLDTIHKDKQSRDKRVAGYAKRDAAAGAAGAKKAETANKKAESEQKKATAAEHDAKIGAIASELKAMAAKGDRSSAAYREKYAAYKAAQDAKRAALGQPPRVEGPQAPEKEKAAPKAAAAKAAPVARRVVVDSRPANAHRIPSSRNRVRAVARYRRG